MIAKSWMTGIREDAMKQLTAQGVLVKPRERAMQEQVVPWLMSQIMTFIDEDTAISKGTKTVVDEGILET